MRQEKQLLLDDLRDKITESKGFILTRYGKMNPNLASQLRFDLMKSGGDFEVIRKTILMKAAEAAGLKLDHAMLDGHIGVVFSSQDLLETAKVVFKFKEANENMMEVVGGRFEGQLYSAKDVEALSKLPTKPEMQAQLLGLFEAVPSELLGVIDAL
ncbi:MAG: 50S ribosomal protein L10, partial [Rhabdochlamydiaceae bacterium]